tara:strand:+ start:1000 stop:1437 length:438 start_codon:yes stop_codon:yes gene_type:complete
MSGFPFMKNHFLSLAGASVLLTGLLTGCSSQTSEGPERYALSGHVKYDGKPVPRGTISFTPDNAKGNHGPATLAIIQDGEYRTSGSKGIIGGAMVVEISGSDGIPVELNGETMESGTELFSAYRMELELPEQSAQQDFEIPKHSN